MKNLLIYISRAGCFEDNVWNNEAEALAKIQIENSLALGWKIDDILLVTNFEYEHCGVKAFIVDDKNYCEFSPTASKINVIVDLFERGLIGDDLWWFHDLDAFQLAEIAESEVLSELGTADLGLTSYGFTTINPGRNLRWSTGTLFFKAASKPIFELWKSEVYRYRANEEVILLEILKKRRHRHLPIKRVNITYNLATRKRDLVLNYQDAIKPLRVLHFHPFDKRRVDYEGHSDNMAVCVYGKNRLGHPLVPDRLIQIFNKHGIR